MFISGIKTRYASHACLILILLASSLSFGFERDLSIKIDGSNRPTFTLSGTGRLVFLYVLEVPPNRLPSIKDPKLWEIRPTGNTKISALPAITYGKVPKEFVQITPASEAPPVLIEGRTYEVGGPADDANGGSIWFAIKGGKSVQVPKPENYP
jgi:hypothetical protein